MDHVARREVDDEVAIGMSRRDSEQVHRLVADVELDWSNVKVGSAIAGEAGVVILNASLYWSVASRLRVAAVAKIVAPARPNTSLPPAWSKCQCVLISRKPAFPQLRVTSRKPPAPAWGRPNRPRRAHPPRVAPRCCRRAPGSSPGRRRCSRPGSESWLSIGPIFATSGRIGIVWGVITEHTARRQNRPSHPDARPQQFTPMHHLPP